MWEAGPDNWVKGQEQYAKGWIECFHAYQHLGPPETHWPIEKFMSYTHADFEKDIFEDGGVDYGIFQSTYLEEWYARGFNNISQNAALLEKHPDKLIVNGRFDPRDGDAGLASWRRTPRSTTSRASSCTRRSGTPARVGSRWPTRRASRSSRSARSWASRTSTSTRARRSGPWTRTRSTSRTSTSRRRATSSSTSSSSTSGCRGSRTSASWRRRSPTSTPACRSSPAG